MVTDLSNTVYMSPVTNTSPSEELMSSTTRPNPTESSNEIILKGNRRPNVTISLPAKSGAGLTITTTAPTYRNYGDAEDGFRLLQQHNQQTLKAGYIAPPITFNQTPPIQDASSQNAAALERLAQSNEAALLPKSEIIRFDGDAKNYQRFITGFDMMITSRNIPDAAKLTYLIQ